MLLLDRVGIETPESEIASGASDKESQRASQDMKSCKIQIGSIQDVERSRLGSELIENIDVVNAGLGDSDKGWNASPQVQQGMDFDRAFLSLEGSPREKGQTQIDGRGVQGIDGVGQVHGEVLSCVQVSGNGNQDLGKVRVDAPVAMLVGIGQGASGDFAADAHMIEPSPQGAKTGLDVPKTLSVSELSKSHTQELVPARKGSNSIVARIAFYACSKFVPGKKIHQLGENGSALIHDKSSALWQKHVPEPVTENSNRFLPKSQATLCV